MCQRSVDSLVVRQLAAPPDFSGLLAFFCFTDQAATWLVRWMVSLTWATPTVPTISIKET